MTKKHPAAAARTTVGAATALAFVGMLFGFQAAAAAEIAATTEGKAPGPTSVATDTAAPAAPTEPAAPAPATPAAPAAQPAPAAPAPAAPAPAAPAPAPAPAAPVNGTSGSS